MRGAERTLSQSGLHRMSAVDARRKTIGTKRGRVAHSACVGSPDDYLPNLALSFSSRSSASRTPSSRAFS